MKVVFFGTPYYTLPILTAVHKKFVTGPGKSPIVGVVTQPPKPTGRKQILAYSPIDKWAHEHKIPIFYSAKELLENGTDADIGILASYGEIIKKEIINLFPLGILVIHPSLLPEYRGASPIPTAIRDGKNITGVSIIKMDEKMDHGPIVTQFKEEIQPTDTTDSLRDGLFAKSADVIVDLLPAYAKGIINLKPQEDQNATFTTLLKKENGFIDLTKVKPIEAERFIRAMFSWPGAWTYLPNKKRLKILKAHIENEKLILDEVQLEGKNPVSWSQFTEAYPDQNPYL